MMIRLAITWLLGFQRDGVLLASDLSRSRKKASVSSSTWI